MRNNETNLKKVRELIAESERLLFITGAGLSVGSGLPTYRGVGGLYDGQHTEDGMPIEEALSGPMMENRPEVTWKYLWEIAEVCRGAEPNSGHEVLAEISIGTSSLFPYISGPVFMAAEFGIPTVEINLDPTDISGAVDYRIEMDCVEALKGIWRN